MKILCVGAGLANASLIHFLNQSNSRQEKIFFEVIDKRNHIGGNCYTEVDKETGITVHKYGPHIFNTNSDIAWKFINTYLTMHSFTNRVKASTPKGIFSMPINLHTINQLYGKSMNVAEATAFMETITAPYRKLDAKNFEDTMLSHLGKDLYNEFIYGYTKKQWGVDPSELPAAVAKRLPFRLNYDDNYYNKKYQGIPEEGYSELFKKIFSAKNVNLSLNTNYENEMARDYDFVIYTGSIDQFFNFEFGRLSYRTVYWERNISNGIFQGNAVINYTTEDKPFTRINEPFFFEPWTHKLPNSKSVYFTEFSKFTEPEDEPYYPIRKTEDLECLNSYKKKSTLQKYSKFIFHGRLGLYRYLDMDMVIEESANLAKKMREHNH